MKTYKELKTYISNIKDRSELEDIIDLCKNRMDDGLKEDWYYRDPIIKTHGIETMEGGKYGRW